MSTQNKLQLGFIARTLALPAALALALSGTGRAENSRIAFSEIGAKATADYQGDALAVMAMPKGARLRCGFQKLEGRATAEGLWLESTEPGGGKLRLTATVVGREVLECGSPLPLWNAAASSDSGRGLPDSKTLSRWSPFLSLSGEGVLAPTGEVSVEGKLVRFIRPGLTEEYSVSVDGVRQDFVIAERPVGPGDLRVELALSGARAEAAAYGAKLTLEGCGRALAYSRLRVADATGRELAAHLEVLSPNRLAVRVADAHAAYPVRIDPTFSDADWVSLNPAGIPGANGEVQAIVGDSSGNVYVGGYFTVIGTVSANYIAKWDGSAWSALGSGMDLPVSALAVSGSNLYAGGMFTTAGGEPANYIAQWDGNAWSALGEGMSGVYHSEVTALAMSGTNLYAGGDFTTAGGVTVNCVAKWDGSAWSALGDGVWGPYNNPCILALTVSGTNLYAGGAFQAAGGVAATNIAKWDGSTWSALGDGVWGGYLPCIHALAVSGTDLYAAGIFNTAGSVSAANIAKWDGSAWSALNSGIGSLRDGVRALVVSGTNLYAGGHFTTAGGVAASSIAKWDGSAWSALGSAMNDCVEALAVSGTNLYAGGEFMMAGGVANYIAKWDGGAWSALGFVCGIDNSVGTLVVSATNLYAGGWLHVAGGLLANHIAKWDGSAWSALGSGMDNSVNAVVVCGTNLYAGGTFTTAGGVMVNGVAKWDGSAWSDLALGMDGGVCPLVVSGTNLYAGGHFTTAGGVAASSIAKWDGSAWSALGSGMNDYVEALAVSGTKLYAGGGFTTAGGVKVNHVAKWDGNAWSALGSGMDGSVNAFAVSGTDLYAGGEFTNAGGVLANYIAKWDGSAWSALGSGMNSYVYALAVSGTNLYAGGGFTTAGEVTVNGIAKWDGSAWSALGSGMAGGYFPYVYALAADGAGHLFVGGNFTLAGTNVSPFIAQANIGATPGRLGGLSYSPLKGFNCTFSNATVGYSYRIQTSPSLAAGSWSDFTNFTYSGPIVITDTTAAAAPKRFYRVVNP